MPHLLPTPTPTHRLRRTLQIGLLALTTLCAPAVFAAETGKNIGEVAIGIGNTFGNVQTFLMQVGALAGAGLCLAGLFKLKAHKDNPQQTPLSVGLVMLAIGGALIALPSIQKTATETVFAGGDTTKLSTSGGAKTG